MKKHILVIDSVKVIVIILTPTIGDFLLVKEWWLNNYLNQLNLKKIKIDKKVTKVKPTEASADVKKSEYFKYTLTNTWSR